MSFINIKRAAALFAVLAALILASCAIASRAPRIAAPVFTAENVSPETPAYQSDFPENAESNPAGGGEIDEPDITSEPETPEPPAPPETAAPGEAPQKTAYITIDDGPSDKITPKMLDILKEHGVKATFFVLPHANAQELFERIISEGHALGNHTYSHKYKTLYNSASTDSFLEDVLKMHRYIKERYDYDMTVFRFPGGAMSRPKSIINPRKEILEELGYRWFDWNASFGDTSSDASAKNPDVLAKNGLRAADGREKVIILLHDYEGMNASVKALEKVIIELKERGYVFDTLENYYTNLH